MPYTPIRLTVPDLVAAVRCSAAVAATWIDPLSDAAFIHNINTPKRMAAWLATIAHESAGLAHLEENLNYQAKRIPMVWPNRFKPIGTANPDDYAGNPAKLANFVYANRMGNGPPESFDGWNYRGRSPMMLTGRDNYTDATAALEHNLVGCPDLALDPQIGAMIAGWFWVIRNLNDLADDDDFGTIVLRVNGGLTDYDARIERWRKATVAMERFA